MLLDELGIPVYVLPDDLTGSNDKVDEKTLLTQLAAAKVVLESLKSRDADAVKFAKEKAEQERLAKEKEEAEAERLAREKAEADAKSEAKRLARERAEADAKTQEERDNLLAEIDNLLAEIVVRH